MGYSHPQAWGGLIMSNTDTDTKQPPRETPQEPASTRFRISNDVEFVTYQNAASDEVYGWFERGRELISKSGGWWRTRDPKAAHQLALLVAQAKGYV